jgi:hypothetical protein
MPIIKIVPIFVGKAGAWAAESRKVKDEGKRTAD